MNLLKRLKVGHLMLAVVIFVVVPFISWYGTWFGRPLSDSQITEYLGDQKARKVQHALQKIAEKIQRNDPSAKQWYPKVSTLAQNPVAEIRINAAWVMGQDNRSEIFHQALVPMLDDRDPLVRRNAALALVRFQDLLAKPELRQMLEAYEVPAPVSGTVAYRLKVDDSVGRGTLLGRIMPGTDAQPVEIRSPLPGFFRRRLVPEGARVAAGDKVLLLGPAPEQVWEALRALYLVGTKEDLPEIERYIRPLEDMPVKVQQQAQFTADAIRRRG
jgi:biotin carboxyl carrier protein